MRSMRRRGPNFGGFGHEGVTFELVAHERVCGGGVGVKRGKVMAIGLNVEGNFEMTKDGSEGHPVRERAGLRLFLSLGNMAADKVGEVKGFVLKNAPDQKNIKIRHIIVPTGAWKNHVSNNVVDEAGLKSKVRDLGLCWESQLRIVGQKETGGERVKIVALVPRVELIGVNISPLDRENGADRVGLRLILTPLINEVNATRLCPHSKL